MLFFTYKLEKYIKNQIFPKILLSTKNYTIKGSFKRKVPYVTDVDIVNCVYPEINRTNIYQKLVALIKELQKENTFILVYVTCGVDNRFVIRDASDAELNRIKNLLVDEELEKFNQISKKYSVDDSRKFFFINEIIWQFYKLRWTPAEVLANLKNLRGGLKVTFTDTIEKNCCMLLQYYITIGNYPIGFDVVTNYVQIDNTNIYNANIYNAATEYQLKLANYNKEYYYMIFPFRYYFRADKKISTELEDLIEKKFGLYKQLMVRIDTYKMLYITNNLTIQTATGIVSSIVKDLSKLPKLETTIPIKIAKASINQKPKIKMYQWYVLLGILYTDINSAVNSEAKNYFYKYLNLVNENDRSKFYLKDSTDSTEKNFGKNPNWTERNFGNFDKKMYYFKYMDMIKK